MGVEILMAKEATVLLRRKPDKLRHIVGLYLMSFLDCEVARTGRAAYFFIRYIDDLTDGDRNLPKKDALPAHIASIRTQVETGNFTDEPKIMRLAEYSLNIITGKARPDDNPRQDFLDVIDAMAFDNERRRERQVLTRKQLEDYYQRTFSPLHNIMLIALQSNLRASDIPELSQCQGRVYSVEHLKSDWQAGIINIPADILSAANLTQESSYEDVDRSSIFKAWGLKELQECKIELLSLQTKLPLSENLTCRIYNVLINSMLKFIDRHLK